MSGNCVSNRLCLPHHRQSSLTLNFTKSKVVLLHTPKCLLGKCHILDLKHQLMRGRLGDHKGKKDRHSCEGRRQLGSHAAGKEEIVFAMTSFASQALPEANGVCPRSVIGDEGRSGALPEETRVQIRHVGVQGSWWELGRWLNS